MPAYETTTHNGQTFGVSSEPMPSRVVGTRVQTGRCRMMFKPAASFYDDSFQDFEEAILGWTRIDPSFADRLNRNYPFLWPFHNMGTMNALELILPPTGRTANPDNNTPTGGINPSTVNPSGYSWWPSSPHLLYDCSMGHLPYSRFLTDTEAYDGVSPPKELGRFIKVYEQAVPREFRRPDYGFVQDNAAQTEVLQVGFVPFIQAEVEYTWFQVPYPDAVPWTTIEATYLCVNATDFDSDELTVGYPAGTLLFTRTSALDDWYYGPGGHKYVDVRYNFTYNPFGWNFYLRPDGTFVALRRKNVTPATPPYLSADYNDLFDPSAG